MKKLFKFSFVFAIFLVVPIFAACGGKGHQHNYVNNVCVECFDGAVAYVQKGTQKTYFDSLQAAVDSAPFAEEASQAPTSFTKIILMKDIRGNGVKISNYRKIEFDFAENTYILDGKMVGSVGTETNGFQILKDTEVIFINGTIKQGEQGAKALIQNYTNIKLENFNLDATNSSATIECETVLSCNHGSSIVTGKSNIIAPEGKNAVVLNYGNLSAYREKGVQLTFDENYVGEVVGNIEYNNCTSLVDWTQKTILTIKSGNFNIPSISDSDEIDENIQISGGTFNINIGKFCLDFYECYQENELYKIREIDQDNVVCYVEAGFQRKYYNSLEEAIKTIGQNVLTKVFLMKNISSAGVIIDGNKDVVIDLNSFIYTITDNPFQIEEGSFALLKNGTITSALIENHGSVEFENCTIESNAEIAIHHYCGTMVFKGNSNILKSKISVEVEYSPDDYGCEVVPSLTFDESFTGVVEGEVVPYVHFDYSDKINLIIMGGTFLNFGYLWDCNAEIYGGTIYGMIPHSSGEAVIYGGTFDYDVTELCADTFAAAKTTIQVEEDGETVNKTVYQVKKGSLYFYSTTLGKKLYYATPEEAVAAAEDGTTIYCLANISRKGFSVEGKSLVFDMRGYTYTITTTTVFKTTKGATLTLKNGTIQPYKQAALKTMIQSYAGVTLDNITMLGTNENYGGKCLTLIDSYYGTITIKGSSNLVASTGNNAIRLYWGANGNYKGGMTINIDNANIVGNIVYDADSNYTEGYDWEATTVLNINNGIFDVEFVNIHSVENIGIYIYGGTFTTDVSAYCPAGYVCTLIENDKYQVSNNA